MDDRKLRGAILRVRYTYLRLIAATEDGLETYQEVDPIRRLTSKGRHRHRLQIATVMAMVRRLESTLSSNQSCF